MRMFRYEPTPGVKSAEFETRTPDIVGSRIQVTNLYGSSHVEEIVKRQPDQPLQLHMMNSSIPLFRLATRFGVSRAFERVGHETKMTRSFEMNAKSMLT